MKFTQELHTNAVQKLENMKAKTYSIRCGVWQFQQMSYMGLGKSRGMMAEPSQSVPGVKAIGTLRIPSALLSGAEGFGQCTS